MSDDTGDVVVTVPKDRWLQWLAEGDLPGDPPEESASWDFYLSSTPPYTPGARCYVVAWGRLRGYAPMQPPQRVGHKAIVRSDGAVPCTVPFPIRGFRGAVARSWDRNEEIAFPDWATAGLPANLRRDVEQLIELRARGPAWRAGLRHWALTGETGKLPRGVPWRLVG
jgi:hypothetical protein